MLNYSWKASPNRWGRPEFYASFSIGFWNGLRGSHGVAAAVSGSQTPPPSARAAAVPPPKIQGGRIPLALTPPNPLRQSRSLHAAPPAHAALRAAPRTGPGFNLNPGYPSQLDSRISECVADLVSKARATHQLESR